MRKGELILMWIAGCWMLVVSIGAAGAVHRIRDLGDMVALFSPVGIICGLIWVTIYKGDWK